MKKMMILPLSWFDIAGMKDIILRKTIPA